MTSNVSRPIPREFNLHWGNGQIIEEASVEGQHHQPSIQLLEFKDGSLSVRFCYYNKQGRYQRGPLMVGEEDISSLRDAIAENYRLRAILRELVI